MRQTSYRMTVDELPSNSTISRDREVILAKARAFNQLAYTVKVIEIITDGEDIISSKVIYESGD